jgi:aryl-alcohol dehydrogenase-like predicted oxidoreductase
MTFGGLLALARPIASHLHAYQDAGGNFIDTADVYSSGLGEEMLGTIAERKLRDTVLATVRLFNGQAHTGGNGAKTRPRGGGRGFYAFANRPH